MGIADYEGDERYPRDRRPSYRAKHPLTAVEVEELLGGALDDLETLVEMLEDRMVEAARAEAEYRSEYARALTLSARKTGDEKAADATYQARRALHDRLRAGALRDAAAEACRSRRAEVEALRTMAANARSAETGRG